MLMKTVRSQPWLRFVYHLEIPLPPSPCYSIIPASAAELKRLILRVVVWCDWAEDEDDLSSVVPGKAGWLAGLLVPTLQRPAFQIVASSQISD